MTLDERLAHGFAVLQAEPDEGRTALEPRPLCIGKVWSTYRANFPWLADVDRWGSSRRGRKTLKPKRERPPTVTPEVAADIAHILLVDEQRRERVMAMVRGLTQGFAYVGMVDGMPKFIERKLEER